MNRVNTLLSNALLQFTRLFPIPYMTCEKFEELRVYSTYHGRKSSPSRRIVYFSGKTPLPDESLMKTISLSSHLTETHLKL